MLKVTILEAKYEAMLEFPGGGRVVVSKPKKNLSVVGAWVFSAQFKCSEQLSFSIFVLRFKVMFLMLPVCLMFSFILRSTNCGVQLQVMQKY